GPLAVGVVLDATGGGTTSASWGAAFLTMAAGVALGPLFLRRAQAHGAGRQRQERGDLEGTRQDGPSGPPAREGWSSGK
ncbi:MAG: hypothetical protein AB1578_04500, partial [Thermodesulfobacteriota bacterium]